MFATQAAAFRLWTEVAVSLTRTNIACFQAVSSFLWSQSPFARPPMQGGKSVSTPSKTAPKTAPKTAATAPARLHRLHAPTDAATRRADDEPAPKAAPDAPLDVARAALVTETDTATTKAAARQAAATQPPAAQTPATQPPAAQPSAAPGGRPAKTAAPRAARTRRAPKAP